MSPVVQKTFETTPATYVKAWVPPAYHATGTSWTVELTGWYRPSVGSVVVNLAWGLLRGVEYFNDSSPRIFVILLRRSLWGPPFGTCSTCRVDNNPSWMCPATISTYLDLGGSDDNIIELDGGPGKRDPRAFEINGL